MATLNSMRTLEMALKAIRDQDYPQERVEILVVDGGSTDQTRETALKYGCRVLDNPEVNPVAAKFIGLREATGDYLVYIDSDEVLMNRNALKKRARAFDSHPDVRMVFSTGYKNPPGIPMAARYINEFGDPFSMFYYRLSKNFQRLIPRLRRRLQVQIESSDYVVFHLSDGAQPILENGACANCIDLAFFRAHFGDLCNKHGGPVHFFYHMQKYTKLFAVTKDDPVLHYSADHWLSFLRKIKWRILNNVFFPSEIGESGFIGRARFDGLSARLRRYAYLPYAFLLVPLVVDTLYLICSRRDFQYWMHIPFTFYTAGTIASMMALKLVGYHPRPLIYGQK
jgi:glycosyltransferase involved in cell wall biosynthesis